MKTFFVSALLAGAAGVVFAQSAPVGAWKTIDDKTGKERSVIRISETAGVLSGVIEKRLDADAKPDDKCDKCTDDRKDLPIQGLTIIRNVKQNADDKALWDGGEILNPEEGKVYRVRIKPIDGGRKLEVRGYIGAPLLGRTQTWIRVE